MFKLHYLLFLLLIIPARNVGSQVVFSETFDEANTSTTGVDNIGGVAWTSSCPTCLAGDYWYVSGGVFEGNDTNGEAIWETGNIDISTCSFVDISMDISEVGDLEACGTGCNAVDWIYLEYNIDGMGWQSAPNSTFCAGGCADLNVIWADDIVGGTMAYSTGCLPGGSTLQIRIGVQCWAASEFWQIDNITVSCGTGPTLITSDPQSVCSPNTVDITDPAVTSGSDPGTLSYWTDNQATNPLGTPGAVGTNGTYYILLEETGGCTDLDSVTVSINPSPTLTLNNQTGCSPATIDLTDPSVANSDMGTLGYYTDPGLSNPVSTPGSVSTGTYYIEADTAGCSTSGQLTVTINTTPTLAVNDTIACSPATVDLTDPLVTNTDVGNLNYYTDPGYTTPVGTPTAVSNGTYYVQADNAGCLANDSVVVIIVQTPTIDPSGPFTACETFDLPAITGTNLTAGVAYYDDTQTNGGVIVNGPITSSATLYMYDGTTGCEDEEAVVITVHPLPEVTNLSGGGTFCEGDVIDAISVTASGTPDFTVYYTFDGIAQSVTGNNPLMLGNTTGTYILTGIDDANCSNSATGTVTLTTKVCDVTIPTAFTPGNDGAHDTWELYNLDTAFPDNIVSVYNRWGQLIYQHVSSTSAPYSSNEWDGTYNGKDLPVGSYYYIIEFDESYNKENETGTVTLLR